MSICHQSIFKVTRLYQFYFHHYCFAIFFLWFFYEFRDIFDLISNSSRRGSKAWIIYSISNVLESVTPLTVVKFTHSNVSYSYSVIIIPLSTWELDRMEKRKKMFVMLLHSFPFVIIIESEMWNESEEEIAELLMIISIEIGDISSTVS